MWHHQVQPDNFWGTLCGMGGWSTQLDEVSMTPLHPIAAAAAGLVLGITAMTAAQEPHSGASTGISPRCQAEGGCTPRQPSFSVGDTVTAEHVHLISRPGLYGLATPPQGQRYAVMEGQIVRVQTDTLQVRSVLRSAPRILD